MISYLAMADNNQRVLVIAHAFHLTSYPSAVHALDLAVDQLFIVQIRHVKAPYNTVVH